MNYSVTYIFVGLLTALASLLGLEIDRSDLETTVTVLGAILLGLGALVGRYRAGGIELWGKKK